MTRRRLLIAALLVPVVLGGVWLLAGSALRGSDRETLPPAPPVEGDPNAVRVTAAPVAIRPVQRTVEALGTFHGFEEVVISAKVEGRVRKISRKVADRVRPGDVLLEIDPTDYELAIRQAEKALQVELTKLGLAEPPGPGFDPATVPAVSMARAKMESAKTQLDLTEGVGKFTSTMERTNRLSESRVAQAEFDHQVLMARSGLATVRMKLDALAMARQQLTDATIRTPVPSEPVPGGGEATYAVASRAVAEGTYVRTGTELYRLVIDTTLKLTVLVPERHSAEIEPGQTVEVRTAASPNPVTGTVTMVTPVVDPITRTFEVEVQVPNAKGRLKPGGFAKAAVHTRLDPKATTVPLEAVVSFAGVTKIFLLEDGHAKQVLITPGVQGENWVEIASPTLPEGAVVITSGHAVIADGTAVMVRSTR